jgi:hypothetical protein
VCLEVVADECFEVAPGEALVPEDDLPLLDQVVITFEQGLGNFAFTQPGVGQSGGAA